MRVYLFEDGGADLVVLLGGKGANLAEMTGLGLPVPPGMTITTEACREYFENGGELSYELKKEVREKLTVIEKKTGKVFGDPSKPLLVSVRSGAAVSMPGMMDTVLNLGLNEKNIEYLIEETGDERFAYDSYRRLLSMFGEIILGVKREKFEEILEKHKEKLGIKADSELNTQFIKKIVREYKKLIRGETGEEFPEDPFKQLFLAIGSVFESWNRPRTKVYRRINRIPDNLCTAVNVQTMVFGNMGPDSGAGVVFTRNPSTGEKNMFGEYLMNSQGEDIVSGVRTPITIDQMKRESHHIYDELSLVCDLLEKHFSDMQDIEFTIEKGKLYILQTRTGKRTINAAIKIAVDMVKEGTISKEEAILRVNPAHLVPLIHPHIDPNVEVEHIAKGLPASPGAVSGIVIFDVDEAEKLGNAGSKIILVRSETTPDDIHGIVAAEGILTSRGGITSHAAIVTRSMGKPCVSGCEDINIDFEKEEFYVNDIVVKKGDIITVDGTTGRVMLGEVPTVESELTDELKELLIWADEIRTLGVRANADTPASAARAYELGADGIGLTRTERMFNASDRLPNVREMILADTEEERRRALNRLRPLQEEDFKEIFREMHGKPICMRLLDLPLHEFLPRLEDLLVELNDLKLQGIREEDLKEKERVLKKVQTLSEYNPMLGHRGCRLGISYPEIYEMQMQAILSAATNLIKEGDSVNLEIMLPLIGEVNELLFIREKMEHVARNMMKKTGMNIKFSIGTMMEIPRACLTADEIAKHADFFSFGTNDLTQTVFGYSRDDAEGKFIHDYLKKTILQVNPFEFIDHKGVGKLMKMAVELGRKTKKDLTIGICGEHGGEPSSIDFCHKLGLDYVSCSLYRIPIAKLAAAQSKLKDN